MHRNHSSEAHSHCLCFAFSKTLGTPFKKPNANKTSKINITVPANYSMRYPRSSQPQSLHHHTSEHSNFSAIIVCSFRHSLGQTTHCQKTRTKFQRRSRIFFTQYAHPDAPKPIHPDKEQICPRQLSWEQTSKFPHRQPLQEWRN